MSVRRARTRRPVARALLLGACLSAAAGVGGCAAPVQPTPGAAQDGRPYYGYGGTSFGSGR